MKGTEVDDDADAGERGLPPVGQGCRRIDAESQLTGGAGGVLVLRIDPDDIGLVDEIEIWQRVGETDVPVGHLHQALAQDGNLFFGIGQLQRVGDVGKDALGVEQFVGIGKIGFVALQLGLAGRELRNVEEQLLGAGRLQHAEVHLGGGGYHHVGGIGDFEVGVAVGLDQGNALTFFNRLHVAGIGLLLHYGPGPVLGQHQ